MAPSSSSPPRKSEVFLSFGGEEIRYTFISHLHMALDQRRIVTYIDDCNLEKDQPNSPDVLKSIEESQFAIIVFSKTYASSARCLDQLVKIMECQFKYGQTVIPIFYDVDPSHVRNQRNTLAESFATHEVNFNGNLEKVQIWKKNLREVTLIIGADLSQRNTSEAACIKKIVGDVCSGLPPRFDVFLSFRGEDTRYTFVSHLHRALNQRGIVTYMDELNLVNGQSISPELIKSIQGSKLAIVIFSKTYASSTWCLDELVEIMDCRSNQGQTVVPIFYGVDKSDVGMQKSSFAESFALQEMNFKDDMEKVEIWKKNLREAAIIEAGHDLSRRNVPEASRVRMIVEDIFSKLH